MIAEYSKKNVTEIINIINEAALKYKGVIPDDCWHEPYMLEKELINEFNNGVQMFGYTKNDKLVGVMGIQEVENATLIRHAYVLTSNQGMGIGKLLLKHLFKIRESSLLYVGTWKQATWAIKFYENFGFISHTRKQTVYLLKKYWNVSSKQIENSTVLEK